MKVQDLIHSLEAWAPIPFAEEYDNVGLLVGNPLQEITGVLIALDSTEAILDEAIRLGHNVVVAHHPILFRGLKKITGSSYVERAIIKAIKNDISIYAIHTNLDNIITGVNHKIADMIRLHDQKILEPKFEIVHSEPIGAGILGVLDQPMLPSQFLIYLKQTMGLPIIKHTALLDKPIRFVAVCGGAGSFLIPSAIKSGADVLITSDLKYHEYFDADGSILLMDIGHYESERYTIDLINSHLTSILPTLNCTQTILITNPVQYFL